MGDKAELPDSLPPFDSEEANNTRRSKPVSRLNRDALISCLIAIGLLVLIYYKSSTCTLHHGGLPSSSCSASVNPISLSEFQARQLDLAKTLLSLNASAYIAEPGANAQYYANITGSDWHLSERPLLLIVTPVLDSGSLQVQPKITILTPSFEATRAKMLSIPSIADNVHYVEWDEDENPYEIAVSSLKASLPVSQIFVDGALRTFITDGLQKAVPDSKVSNAPTQITVLRERKSTAELELLMCANEATLLALRSVRRRMYLGMREPEAREMIAHEMTTAGLKDAGCLVLFGENAALPHGSGTNRVLGKSDFALFDCTGSLHGYYSDLTRTIALDDSEIPDEHQHIWRNVHTAQTIAVHKARKGAVAKTVDRAARDFLEMVGYGKYFTHRLGHGIGIEVHEGPYLNGGSEAILDSGHTFSDEPGVYIEGKVGVRLEDCFYIDNQGEAVFLTSRVGGQATSPWSP